MIIGTAGHIDHGKTSLVRALTGVDTDRLKEEKARGISIDLGFAYLPAPDGSVLGFVDVPGHERFVHTMVAGASGIDFVVLAIAAGDGVMPQTLEHLAIIDLIGVRHGVVRDRLDNGRNLAIQILEFLDRHGVTLRRGDRRRINQHRLELFAPATEAARTGQGRESSPVGRADFKSGQHRPSFTHGERAIGEQ